jgi:hypothetical protein
MTQLKLFTLVGVANLVLEFNFELLTETHEYLRPGDSKTRGQHRFFQERFKYDTLRNSFQRTARKWNLFTLVGVANLVLEFNFELLYGAGPNCGVW